MVAYECYTDGEAVFCLDDPPHALKRVGAAMKNKALRWELESNAHPMTMKVLKAVYLGINSQRDEMGLRKFRKLKQNHFDERMDRSQKMKVKLVAQVLSATMVRAIDTVCTDTSVGIFPEVPYQQRKELLSKVRELCLIMNRWFDMCNSKDPNRHKDWRVIITPNNGAEIADEFLSTLKFFQDWKESLTDTNGKLHEEHFVPLETYATMKRCCYGFASIIYDQVLTKKRDITLCRLNQDRCENHFGHVRIACGNVRHPLQAHANACALTSHLKRAIKASAHCNVTLCNKKQKIT